MHAEISAWSLAENKSINPKQCRKLKLRLTNGKVTKGKQCVTESNEATFDGKARNKLD